MDESQRFHKTSSQSNLALGLMVFSGLACAILAFMVEGRKEKLLAIALTGGTFVVSTIFARYYGKKESAGALVPSRMATLIVACIFAALGLLGTVLAIVAIVSTQIVSAISFGVTAFGMFGYAVFNLRLFQEPKMANQSVQPTSITRRG